MATALRRWYYNSAPDLFKNIFFLKKTKLHYSISIRSCIHRIWPSLGLSRWSRGHSPGSCQVIMGQGNSVRRCPFLSMTMNTSQLLLPAKCHLGTRPNNEWLSDPNYTCKLGESLKWHVFTLHLLMAREKGLLFLSAITWLSI